MPPYREAPCAPLFPVCNCVQEDHGCRTSPSPTFESRRSNLESPPSTSTTRRLRAFGVRVLPSGAKRFFIHVQHRGERVWRIVGDATAINVAEARTRAASMLATIKHGADVSAPPKATLFETFAEAVFQRYARVWKPRTLEVNRIYLRNQILPRFAGRQIPATGDAGGLVPSPARFSPTESVFMLPKSHMHQ